ncbi:MAG: phosphonate C-P lyase system protein PhnG [Rhodospirillaceae bacterium]|nr:phosphonate C-P lyase system protein PhnG [Rhodospirillaceae bacterium]
MAVLARVPEEQLVEAWCRIAEPPAYRRIRGPEAGMVMVRGRAGGTGGRFNLGEMTVTRCTVALEDGPVGHAYVAGTNARRAELAALFDALMQHPRHAVRLRSELIDPAAAEIARSRALVAQRAAATRVEFFTLARGEV